MVCHHTYIPVSPDLPVGSALQPVGTERRSDRCLSNHTHPSAVLYTCMYSEPTTPIMDRVLLSRWTACTYVLVQLFMAVPPYVSWQEAGEPARAVSSHYSWLTASIHVLCSDSLAVCWVCSGNNSLCSIDVGFCTNSAIYNYISAHVPLTNW